MQNTGVDVEFHGLELSSELYNLAVDRLPDYSSRLFLGNGLYWHPPFRFDYVYTMVLPDIPSVLRRDFLVNLYENCLKPGGKLILGPWGDHELEDEIAGLGFAPTGYCEKTTATTPPKVKRIVWIDKPAGAMSAGGMQRT